jgi:hypothetical protein
VLGYLPGDVRPACRIGPGAAHSDK